MRRIIIFTSVFVTVLTFSGCSTIANSMVSSTINSTNGQTTTNNNQQSSNMFSSLLSALIGNNTKQSNIVGTWVYKCPKVVFESESVLAKLGGSIASNKVESMMSEQLEKVGFTAGVTKMSFEKNGSCKLILGNREMPGTYTFDSSTNTMKITGALGKTSVSPTVSVVGNEIYMVFDADMVLNIMSSVANMSSNTAKFSSLLSNYNGMKMGWAMTKEK